MRRLRVVSWSILSARLSLSAVSSSTELDAVLASTPSFLRRSMTSWLGRLRSLASWKTLTFPIRLTPLRPVRHALRRGFRRLLGSAFRCGCLFAFRRCALGGHAFRRLRFDFLALLFLALDVDAPAHELGGQADVLALLADGEAQLLVLDHDLHDPLLLVEDADAAHLGRRERVDHEGGGVVVPFDDVDLLAAQLADDGLHARALHAHAGAHGIHVLLAGDHRDLGPLPRLAHAAPDLDGAVVDLGHLHLEELDEQGGIGAADHDLWSLGRLQDLDDGHAHAVARLVGLGPALLLAREQRLRAPEVDHEVAHFLALDDPVDHLAHAAGVLGEDVVPLRLPDLLEDDLLRGLGRDAAEDVRGLGELDLLADLGLGDELLRLFQADLRLGDLHHLHDLLDREDLDLAGLVVEAAAEVFVVLVVLLRRGEDRVLDGGDDDVRGDVLLPADLLDLLSQLVRHKALLELHFQAPVRDLFEGNARRRALLLLQRNRDRAVRHRLQAARPVAAAFPRLVTRELHQAPDEAPVSRLSL